MENPDNKFWQSVKKDLSRLQEPKHHLELYSMCKSENPYIKFAFSHIGKSKTPPTSQQTQSLNSFAEIRPANYNIAYL